MTRYQPLIVWNGNWIEVIARPHHSKRDLVRDVRGIKDRWSKNVLLFYVEWDDEHPEEAPVIGRFSNKELLGEEDVPSTT